MELRRIHNLYNTFLNHLEWSEWEPAAVFAMHLCEVFHQAFSATPLLQKLEKSDVDRILHELKSEQKALSNAIGAPPLSETALKDLAVRFDFYLKILSNKKPNVFYLRIRKILKMKSFYLSAVLIFFLTGILIATRSLSLKNHNLVGHYFSDMELNNLERTRLDAGINFNWGYSAPFLTFRGDQFSVRWTGFLECNQAGEYSFRLEVDDGARLWINDILWMDAWAPRAPQVKSVKIFLTEGHHKIKVEYYEIDAYAGIQLKWKKPGEKKYAPIPRKNIKSQI